MKNTVFTGFYLSNQIGSFTLTITPLKAEKIVILFSDGMNQKKKMTPSISWSWTDKFSSYRFWGIISFYILLLATFLLITNLHFKHGGASLRFVELRFNPVKLSISVLIGFFLGWQIILKKNRAPLFLFSIIIIIGLILLNFDRSFFSFSVGEILVGAGFFSIFLSLPIIILRGRGNIQTFFICFGIIILLSFCLYSLKSILTGNILKFAFEHNRSLIIIGLMLTLIAIILLLTVNSQLFYGNPPIRDFSLIPKHRSPIAIAFFSLIPFCYIYILYRYHGEVNSINPTKKIMSPVAAACFILFFPFLFPLVANSLNHSLLSNMNNTNTTKKNNHAWTIIWSFLFPPITLALLQSNINKLIAKYE